MKILHVAVFTPSSTNIWQAHAFEELGHEVVRYDYRAKAEELGFHRRDQELIVLCQIEGPDLILFSKCNQMDVEVVKQCGEIGKTALWYMDPRHNIDAELIEKMKASNYVFSALWDGYRTGKQYNKNTFRINEGYNPKEHFPNPHINQIKDVSFIGNKYIDRLDYHRQVPFEFVSNAYGKDHAKIVHQTKINLNFTHYGDGTSDRTYKILAAGGFLLTTPWEQMEFTPKIHLDIFTNPQELKSQIFYYLSRPQARETIAFKGSQKVKQYDNINFAKQIIYETSTH
jgi:hypothetical protein